MLGPKVVEALRSGGIAPKRDYVGKWLLVQGEVRLFDGLSEIVVDAEEQIELEE
jgi:hypothetical protein